MKILYYTSSATGSGNLVLGISIAHALRRCGVHADFTILTSGLQFAGLADRMSVRHIEIPFEDEAQLSPGAYPSSELFKAVTAFNPDVLIVMMHWFMFSSFIQELPCRKVFLSRQVDERFFSMDLGGTTLAFRPGDWDLTLAIEPFPTSQPFRKIDPIVIRNQDEIFPREKALKVLGLKEGRKHCLFAFNGAPGEFEENKKTYSYLEDVGYSMVYSTNFQGGLFPVVDYFNAFDMIVCGAGYNAFWEAVFFEKEAIFIPYPRRFENQAWRVENCQDYAFTRNGADELVEMMLGM